MDVDQCSPQIWAYDEHEQGLEELKNCPASTSWELEMTVLSAKDEISRRECDLIQLKELLSRTIKERDEAQLRCQSLQDENLLLLKLHHHKPENNAASISISATAATLGSSESESDTSASSTPEQVLASKNNPRQLPAPVVLPEAVLKLIADKALPEKGRLLKAVMEAGPLLETVLLAGPLPQWQHPPPQLNFVDIPLVSISINPVNHARDWCIISNGRAQQEISN